MLLSVSLLLAGSVVSEPAFAAGDLVAKTTKTDDGMAQVTFQPVGGADMVTVYTRTGQPIAQLNWAASFVVSVPERSLREATTEAGIDIHSLLRRIGTVRAGKKVMVAADLPVTNEPVRDPEGRVLPPGTEVFFALERLAKIGTIAPTNAYGGASEGEGGAANEFNSRLLDSGVTGVQKKPAQTAAAKAAAAHRHEPVHGHAAPNVPLEAPKAIRSEARSQNENPNAFLSAPTCTESTADSMWMRSWWGKRKRFRTDNGQLSSGWHDGVDIAGRKGTPVVAAADGCMTVKDMRFNRGAGYGLTIKLDHKNGLKSQYSHMDSFTPEIREWARKAKAGAEYCVLRGDRIGSVGETGNCTGPHLHFGLQRNGRSVNPLLYMQAATNQDLSNTCSDLAEKNAVIRAAAELARAEAAGSGAVAQSPSASSPGAVRR